jgi:hypothetical protein
VECASLQSCELLAQLAVLVLAVIVPNLVSRIGSSVRTLALTLELHVRMPVGDNISRAGT